MEKRGQKAKHHSPKKHLGGNLPRTRLELDTVWTHNWPKATGKWWKLMAVAWSMWQPKSYFCAASTSKKALGQMTGPVVMAFACWPTGDLAVPCPRQSTCGLVAMTSASHAEGRQFDPGQV